MSFRRKSGALNQKRGSFPDSLLKEVWAKAADVLDVKRRASLNKKRKELREELKKELSGLNKSSELAKMLAENAVFKDDKTQEIVDQSETALNIVRRVKKAHPELAAHIFQELNATLKNQHFKPEYLALLDATLEKIPNQAMGAMLRSFRAFIEKFGHIPKAAEDFWKPIFDAVIMKTRMSPELELAFDLLAQILPSKGSMSQLHNLRYIIVRLPEDPVVEALKGMKDENIFSTAFVDKKIREVKEALKNCDGEAMQEFFKSL